MELSEIEREVELRGRLIPWSDKQVVDIILKCLAIDRNTRGNDLAQRYKRALEGLTPGGSEFVNDPEYCEAYVREVIDSKHRHIVRLAKRVHELEESWKNKK